MPRVKVVTPVAQHYSRNAERLSRTYLDVAFADVHSAWGHHLPARGARVLDVGAGAGRDARALAELGYQVTAVEPSSPMRLRGARAVQPMAVEWIDDRLPDLARVRTAGVVFDLVLCSAVLMHLEPKALGSAMGSLAAVTTPDGLIVVTVRASRAGDPAGVFHDHSDTDILRAAASARLELIDRGENADRLSRPDATWRWFVFQRY